MLAFIIITVLLHCVVVKETRSCHIMPLNDATLLIFKFTDKNERVVHIFDPIIF